MTEHPVDPLAEPQGDPAIDAFWNLARFHAKLNSMPSYFGPTPLESVPPPAWGFDDEEQLEQLLADGTTELSGTREEYGEELPEVGALGIVCDADGQPRVLVATAGVDVSGDVVTERLDVVWEPER
ncbi:hypothetical protein GCM10009623_38070 [Nocardioides aestuarii]|uniref:ASCH domain-containing protein n=1 Tax=Nocardioides aestuarii TaxID=252231 RepID=A0ABW4TQ78_9ACTN